MNEPKVIPTMKAAGRRPETQLPTVAPVTSDDNPLATTTFKRPFPKYKTARRVPAKKPENN